MSSSLKSMTWPLLLVGVFLIGALSACGNKAQVELKMAPVSQLPAEIQRAPANVCEAYQFALANKEILEKIPCYCGCGNVGHTSNYMCYIQDDGSVSGQVVFDAHALGCSICVDITRDVMKMLKEGKDLKVIRATIDRKYSQFGPPTHTQPVE